MTSESGAVTSSPPLNDRHQYNVQQGEVGEHDRWPCFGSVRFLKALKHCTVIPPHCVLVEELSPGEPGLFIDCMATCL